MVPCSSVVSASRGYVVCRMGTALLLYNTQTARIVLKLFASYNGATVNNLNLFRIGPLQVNQIMNPIPMLIQPLVRKKLALVHELM